MHMTTVENKVQDLVPDTTNQDYTACKMTLRNNDYYLFSWYRLAPGSTELQPLGTWNDGSYDAKDAHTEMRQEWPQSTEVEYYFLANERNRRAGEPYTQCNQCGTVAYEVCNQCGNPTCYTHYQNGDFEHWCLTCWYEHICMMRIDGNISLRDWRRTHANCQTRLYSVDQVATTEVQDLVPTKNVTVTLASINDKQAHRGTVYTACVKPVQGIPNLDIFTPSREIVYGHKRYTGDTRFSSYAPVTDEQYKREYARLLRSRADDIRSWLDALDEDVTICCYCKQGTFCHRTLLATWIRSYDERFIVDLH